MQHSLRYRVLSGLLILALLLSPTGVLAFSAAPTMEAGLAPEDDPLTPLSGPSVTAHSAIVIDFDTGEVLFNKDGDSRRPPASMSKIMTAFIVYEEIAAGRLSMDSLVHISNHASHFHRGSWPGHIVIPAGSQQRVETLLYLIMLPSHNGACIAIAEHISGSEWAFVQRMNQTAQQLGLNAHYENAHGLWGNSKSARATAILTQEFIRRYPDILRITSTRFFSFNGVAANNTNRILSDPRVDGFKTGTTGAAGFCLSSTATQNGRRVISVTMNSASNDARYSDSMQLLNFGLAEQARRDAFLNDLTIDLSANMPAARRNTDTTFTARLGNLNTSYFTRVQGGGFTVNGQAVATFDAFSPVYRSTFTLPYFLPADSTADALEVGFFVDLPNGDRRTGTMTLPVSDQSPALFRDIHTHWAEESIEQAVEAGLFSGTGNNRFSPNGDMTRAMFVTVLGRMAEQMGIDVANSPHPPFGDVTTDGWYSNYVAWAFAEDITQGVSDTWFGTRRAITRQEAATLFYRFMQHYSITLPGDATASFPDAYRISDWASAAVAEAVRTGLIVGLGDGRFAPAEVASRAQLAVIFMRFMDAYAAMGPVDVVEAEEQHAGVDEYGDFYEGVGVAAEDFMA